MSFSYTWILPLTYLHEWSCPQCLFLKSGFWPWNIYMEDGPVHKSQCLFLRQSTAMAKDWEALFVELTTCHWYHHCHQHKHHHQLKDKAGPICWRVTCYCHLHCHHFHHCHQKHHLKTKQCFDKRRSPYLLRWNAIGITIVTSISIITIISIIKIIILRQS